MANSFYNHGTTPITLSSGASALIRAELDAVTTGFDKFPSLAANANKALVINGAGTAITITTGTLALAGNFTTTGAFNTTLVQQASVTLTLPGVDSTLSVDNSIAPGFLYGLKLANNATDPTNDIDIATGQALSTDGLTNMTLGSSLIKRLDATWVAGTNQGGRSSSLGISDTTWHVHLISVGGVVDVGFDTSVTAANLIADHGATAYRRIGSILREAGLIVLFIQVGDFFYRDPAIVSSGANPGTASTNITINTPLGIVTFALVVGIYLDTTPTVVKFAQLEPLSSLTLSSSAEGNCKISMSATDTIASSPLLLPTDTSSQLRFRLSTSDADITFKVSTYGWIDTRDRNG